jgi:hypothetical protein
MSQLSTGYISGVFGGLVNNADDKVSTFITDHTGSVGADGSRWVKPGWLQN